MFFIGRRPSPRRLVFPAPGRYRTYDAGETGSQPRWIAVLLDQKCWRPRAELYPAVTEIRSKLRVV